MDQWNIHLRIVSKTTTRLNTEFFWESQTFQGHKIVQLTLFGLHITRKLIGTITLYRYCRMYVSSFLSQFLSNQRYASPFYKTRFLRALLKISLPHKPQQIAHYVSLAGIPLPNSISFSIPVINLCRFSFMQVHHHEVNLWRLPIKRFLHSNSFRQKFL